MTKDCIGNHSQIHAGLSRFMGWRWARRIVPRPNQASTHRLYCLPISRLITRTYADDSYNKITFHTHNRISSAIPALRKFDSIYPTMADHTLARMGLEITSPTVEGIPFVALPPPPTMNLNNAIKMNRFELWGWFGQASAAGKISISFDQLDAVYELGLNGADFLEDQLQAKDFQGSMSKVETFTARHLVQLANEVRAKFEVTELPPSVSKKRKATEMMTGSQDAESSMIKGYRLFLSQGEG